MADPSATRDATQVCQRLGLEVAPNILSALAQVQQLADDWIARLPAAGESCAQAAARYYNQALTLLQALQQLTPLLQVAVGAEYGWYALLGYADGQAVLLWAFGAVHPHGCVVGIPQDEATTWLDRRGACAEEAPVAVPAASGALSDRV